MLLAIHPKDPEPRKIHSVLERLRAGAVIVCPTDTVYAFACSAHQIRAIERVAKLKGVRPQKADLSLICKDLSQLSMYTRAVDTPAFRVMKKALPGPYTFILHANSEVPRLFMNNKRTVGIRVPAHPVPQALVEGLGHALVVASVHDMNGIPDHANDPEAIEARFGNEVDLIIDSGVGGIEPSTVIDLTDGRPEVVREGKGPIDDLL